VGASVSWFEIPADDPKKLVGFYEAAFGWTHEQYPGMDYFMLDSGTNGDGIGGAITKRDPLRSPVVTAYVESLDDALATVRSLGGSIVADKADVPGVGTYAYAADPEGNVFGLLQPANPS
jgi:predicted enzyme related to lactoylglutathione lyase